MTELSSTCYICLTEGSEFADPNPCICKGSIKIHKTCLSELKETTSYCGICKERWHEHGLIQTWYPETGELESEVMYINGRRHGTFTFYNRNGTVNYSEDYRNGVVHGFKRSYYENGQLETETFVLNGFSQYCTMFRPNGIKKVEMLYGFNTQKLNGPFKRYYENGNVWFECTYINGLRQGLYKCYGEDGSLLYTENYVDNKPVK